MLTKEDLQKIQELEKEGHFIIVTNEDGILQYSTRLSNSNYCDNCPYLHLSPDPDPYDNFCCDMKAECKRTGKIIARYLGPTECSEIPKLDSCPFLIDNLVK